MVLPVERSKVSDIIRTGLVRVLLTLSGFLVRVTGLINRINHTQTADDDGMYKSHDSWPAEWTQRIKNAKHVTWFSFKAKRNVPVQGQKTMKNAARKDGVSPVDLLDSRDTDDSSRAREPHSGARSVSIENSPPALKVFDPRTRLWVYESSGESSAAGSERAPMGDGLPTTGRSHTGKAEANPGFMPFPFHNVESSKPLPEPVVSPFESLEPKSFDLPRKTQEADINLDTHLNGHLQEPNWFESSPIQKTPRSEARYSETTRNETKASILSSQEQATGNVPPYPRWAEIGAFDNSSVPFPKPSTTSSGNTMIKEQGQSPNGFNEDPATTLNRPWPELEEFVFPEDRTISTNRGDSQRRLLQLKHEQKGSLWSVSRF